MFSSLLSPLLFGVVVLLGFPMAYVATIVHEMGHAVAGRLAGYHITSFGLGTGRPFFRVTLPNGLTRFYLCHSNPFLGFTWTLPRDVWPSWYEQFVLVIGGILANLLFAVFLLAFWLRFSPHDRLFFPPCIGINIVLGLMNLQPRRRTIAGSRIVSDGARAGSLLRFAAGGVQGSTHAFFRDVTPSFRPLWEAVGDTAALCGSLIGDANSALEVGALGRAEAYLDEAAGLVDRVRLPALGGAVALAQVHLRIAQGRWAETEALLGEAQEAFRAGRSATGETLTGLTRVQRDAVQGLAKGASAEMVAPLLEALRSRLVREQAELALAFHALLVYVVVTIPEADTSPTRETVWARYENARSAHASPATDVRVFRAIAAFLDQRCGDAGGALPYYEAAFAAALQTTALLAGSPEIRAEYLERQIPLMKAYIGTLRRLGRAREADSLVASFGLLR